MNIHLTLKTCLILMAFFIFGKANAQINLEFTSVNEYAFNTKQALNLIVTNGTTKSFNVIFNGKISDANGQKIVEFKTHEATLNLGATIFSPQTISFSETQYYNNDIAEIEASSGTYPSGNYSICVWATCTTPDCNGSGATISTIEPKCIQVHIENPTPLILATPENEAEIESTRPLYTWIPPSPVAGSSNLNYTMILVEMLEGQSKSDALTQNRPLIELEGIGNPSLMHPSDIPELEKGKWYAWQVQAYVGKTPIAKSEQWKFKVKKKEEKKDKPTYVKLKTDDKNIYNVSQYLNFIYLEEYIPQVLNLSIFSIDGVKVYNNIKDYKTERGENTYSILLSDLKIDKNIVYELKVLNARGELYVLRFIYN